MLSLSYCVVNNLHGFGHSPLFYCELFFELAAVASTASAFSLLTSDVMFYLQLVLFSMTNKNPYFINLFFNKVIDTFLLDIYNTELCVILSHKDVFYHNRLANEVC